MKAGFTGTQSGMTKQQERKFISLMNEMEPSELHHGDCIGSDLQANDIFNEMFPTKPIVVHPPKNPAKRAYAFGYSKVVLGAKDYLERNRDIVDDTDILIATPETKTGVNRSGTWATVRYASRQKKPIVLIFPDGIVERR